MVLIWCRNYWHLGGISDVFKPSDASPQRACESRIARTPPSLSLSLAPSHPNPRRHHFERKTDPDQTEAMEEATTEDKSSNGLQTASAAAAAPDTADAGDQKVR